MNQKASLFLFLIITGVILTIFYHVHTKDQIVIWQNGVQVEGVMKSFTFTKGMQGKIAVDYRIQGRDLAGEIDGFYNDYILNKNVALLIDNNDYQNINWADTIRFWLIELIVFGFWGGILLTSSASYILLLKPFQKQLAGLTFCAVAITFMFIIEQYDKSFDLYIDNAEPVLATVVSVDTEVCQKKNGKKSSSYTCYRPTYRYGYGRQSYTVLSERTLEEEPFPGSTKELWVWNEDRQVAKDLKSRLPTWAYYLFMAFLGIFMVIGIRYLLGFGRGPIINID
ncbi:hypothetical protein [Lewinella cohaerens]|uniref:hypothetical protein n=1 Tax=Lewinella cohaerens TaxID=70995 RepID=UPI00037610BD|nr:hypothetical protein [Lewinella cohaerens]